MDKLQCPDKSDAELVQLTLNDQAYFTCLIDRYEQKLTSYILRISNVSKQEAEDVLQETFIKAYYNLNGFNQKLKFSSWIYRIAHNEVISNFRKNKVRPQGNSWDVDDEMINNLASDEDMVKHVDQKFLKEHCQELIEKLDLKYREVIFLKYFQEKSYQEISDIIKKPPGTVATLISRAKKQLRKEIDKQNSPTRKKKQ